MMDKGASNASRTIVAQFGVNYGNRFIPEEWMDSTGSFFQDVAPQEAELGGVDKRLCLADLSAEHFPERMQEWLREHIRETDFKEMKELGVEFVRVPTGYWNWVNIADGLTPNGPNRERMQNLQAMPAEGYLEFFDQIFEFAAKYELRVLLDLHGLPGSQNGEMHSGLSQSSFAFNSDWNLEIAVKAVRAMVRFGSKKRNLYGIQVMNEPHISLDLGFLHKYYEASILAAREEGLHWRIPVILFSWTDQMCKWKDDHFGDVDRFGCVVWDTHIYHVDKELSTVDAVKKAYWADLLKLGSFHRRQLGSRRQGGAMVLEWSLAGPQLDAPAIAELARVFVYFVGELCLGSAFWNFDAPFSAWSLRGSAAEYDINWQNLAKGPLRHRKPPAALADPTLWDIAIKTVQNSYFRAEPDGHFTSSSSHSGWETYMGIPLQCGRLALKTFHNTYVQAKPDGTLGTAFAIGDWETFTLGQDGQDGYHYIQDYHGNYLSIPEDTEHKPVRMAPDRRGAWEALILC